MKTLEVQEIDSAIDKQLSQLGSIVMVLIGEVLDNVVTRAPIGHSLFSQLELNPEATTALVINDKTIQVSSISDEEETDSLKKATDCRSVTGWRFAWQFRMGVRHVYVTFLRRRSRITTNSICGLFRSPGEQLKA
jgi:hypothetical protein